MLLRYRRNVYWSLKKYLRDSYGDTWHIMLTGSNERKCNDANQGSHQHHQLQKDVEAGTDALTQGCGATWWEWAAGSSLMFWHWTSQPRKEAQDGTFLFVHEQLSPKFWERLRIPHSKI
eukprot:15340654-Ditylum_brightwellii.AAC.1